MIGAPWWEWWRDPRAFADCLQVRGGALQAAVCDDDLRRAPDYLALIVERFAPLLWASMPCHDGPENR